MRSCGPTTSEILGVGQCHNIQNGKEASEVTEGIVIEKMEGE